MAATWGGMSSKEDAIAAALSAHSKSKDRSLLRLLRPLSADPAKQPSEYGKRLAKAPAFDAAKGWLSPRDLIEYVWEHHEDEPSERVEGRLLCRDEEAEAEIRRETEVWTEPHHDRVLRTLLKKDDTQDAKRGFPDLVKYTRSLGFDEVTQLLEPLHIEYAKRMGWEGYLDEVNAHPEDKRITFEEGPHIYRIDGIALPGSVTGLIHDYFPHFDPAAVVAKMKLPNPKYVRKDGTPMDREEILQQWASGNAADQGTRVHLWVEYANNAIAKGDEPLIPNTKEGGYFRDWAAEAERRGWKPFRTEMRAFDHKLMLAGSVDMIYETADGSLAIVDWKNAKEIKTKSFYNREEKSYEFGHGPCSKLHHCNQNHYFLQLTLYKLMLERLYGYTVSYIGLVIFHREHPTPGWKWRRGVTPPKADRYLEFECKVDLTETVDEIMGERAAHVSTFRRCAGVLAKQGGKKRGRDDDHLVDLKIGNLFNCPQFTKGKFALAHCVGKDFAMGAGIALQFRNQFGRPGWNTKKVKVGKTYAQSVQIKAQEEQKLEEEEDDAKDALAGREEILSQRYIMHIVTKPRSSRCLPTKEDFREALEHLFQQVERSPAVDGVAMPMIGSGLDRLDFTGFVLPLIKRFSSEYEVPVHVYIK